MYYIYICTYYIYIIYIYIYVYSYIHNDIHSNATFVRCWHLAETNINQRHRCGSGRCFRSTICFKGENLMSALQKNRIGSPYWSHRIHSQ